MQHSIFRYTLEKKEIEGNLGKNFLKKFNEGDSFSVQKKNLPFSPKRGDIVRFSFGEQPKDTIVLESNSSLILSPIFTHKFPQVVFPDLGGGIKWNREYGSYFQRLAGELANYYDTEIIIKVRRGFPFYSQDEVYSYPLSTGTAAPIHSTN